MYIQFNRSFSYILRVPLKFGTQQQGKTSLLMLEFFPKFSIRAFKKFTIDFLSVT